MPARFPPALRMLAGAALAAALAQGAFAQGQVQNSNIDAPLFYELLIGELEANSGDPGVAYQVMLDAARKTQDEQLFKRATEFALQARAGEQALAAAALWRETLPESLEAHRYLIQLLVVLNRPAETAEPIRSLVGLTPQQERNALIINLPRFFARTPDRAGVATLLADALQPYAAAPATRAAVRLTVGRAWILAQQPARALAIARQGQAEDPGDDGASVLALELMPTQPDAEAIVVDQLKQKPDADSLRAAYAGTLSTMQRYGDAAAQLEIVTTHQPTVAPPLLTLGAIYVELHQPKQAIDTLNRYVAVVQRPADAGSPPAGASGAAGTASAPAGQEQAQGQGQGQGQGSDDDAVTTPERGVTRAWLLMSQAAEQQKDFKGAEAYLAKVDSPQLALEVQARRASLLAKQGKLAQARALIQKAPERTPEDARAKVFAEVQLLREARQWSEAYKVLAAAAAKTPADVDVLYEQSMMADKLGRPDEMERLLRRVIEIKPDHEQAHNALGYSLAERGVRLPEAKSLIQKALELSPGDPFITDSLGWVEYRMGNRDEAVRLLRTAYRQRPDTEIAAHLGEVLWTTGQQDEARKVWREGRNRDSVNDVLRETLARLQVDL